MKPTRIRALCDSKWIMQQMRLLKEETQSMSEKQRERRGWKEKEKDLVRLALS